MTYISADDGQLTRLFELDAAVSVTVDDSVDWSEYTVESGAVLSDFAAPNPRRFTISGVITACPESGLDTARPGALYDALDAVKAARRRVWLTTDRFAALVVLDSCKASEAASDGEFLSVEITAHIVGQTRWEYTRVPAELLAPEVKPGSATASGTADSATEQADPPQRKSMAAKLADGDFGDLGGML